MSDKLRLIIEDRLSGPRLGRHVQHDERSRAYPAQLADRIGTVTHRRVSPVQDQGNIGACTGYAMAGLLTTEPIYNPEFARVTPDPLALYQLATQLDGFPGEFPSEDPGSSGLGVARAAKKLGYIHSYRHAFGIDQALAALTLRPVITGTLWYEGMDEPAADGTVRLDGEIRGGHEYLVLGLDEEAHKVLCVNSWGAGWGMNGAFVLSWQQWDTLLEQDGDVLTGM